MKRNLQNMTLFQKFVMVIILVGLIPMLILTFFISNKMIQDYREALRVQYEQAAFYVGNSIETMLDSYNTISKMSYYYNYGNELVVNDYRTFDNLRQIVHGVDYAPEERELQREKDMGNFLRYVEGADGYLVAAHFVGEDEKGKEVNFHYSSYTGYFIDEDLFEKEIGYENIDKTSNKVLLLPTHDTVYYSGINEPVFTVARNYFDIRGEVGHSVYVGTLFVDVRLKRLEQIFRTVKFNGTEEIYIVDGSGNCFYSNIDENIGTNVKDKLEILENDTKRQLVLTTNANEYGLYVVVIMNTKIAFSRLRTLQKLMYLVLGVSTLALVICSVFFSRRLVKPVHAMMEQMGQVENGNFDIQLPVRTTDEIGILSDRFNQMSRALKKYINEVYVAQIRQTEAELTALKSQIYPHFLYNTLEIIRMTAVENNDNKVSEMIEALSVQIHYLIGTVQDMVPLEKEMEIVRKYIYLLNCRVPCKIQLVASSGDIRDLMVPKLILQPIVENAYIHGIKPKKGNGSILIETQISGEELEISVMDNGIGMDNSALEKIQDLLQGDDPGIKNEYNWQSIGMKNIHDRLRYLYGEKYGIQVTSTPNVGTMVCVLMPVIRVEKTERKTFSIFDFESAEADMGYKND